MDQFFREKWEKTKYFLLISATLLLILIIANHYKNEDTPTRKNEIVAYSGPELKLIKDFFFSQIRSPFFYKNYEVKKGDNIQKILKNYKIKNKEIDSIIKEYKKYGNSKQLLAGNKVEITIKKTSNNKGSSRRQSNNNKKGGKRSFKRR